MHENHLLQLLLGIIQWIDPPDAVSRAIESGKCERLACTFDFFMILLFNILSVFLMYNIFFLG